MINTTIPAVTVEEPQAAEKPAPKMSSVAKPRATKKSTAARKKAATKKTPRKSALAKKVKSVTSKTAENVMQAKAKKPSKQAKQLKAKVTKPKTSKVEKSKKPKLVRDSFTMPAQEYAVLGKVKKACHTGGIVIKKSELLRIGVAQLAAMNLKNLKAAQAALTPLRAGRPKKQK